jgi:prefoldin subunit 5
MDYQKLLFGIILVVNMTFILGSLYALWKISEATEGSTAVIQNAAKATQDSLRMFREALETIKEAAKNSTKATEPRSETAAAQRMTAELQRLSSSIEALDASRLNRMLNELGNTIKGLPDVTSSDPVDQAARAHLDAQRERLNSEVEQLQKRLDESSQVIGDLRRENRNAFTSGSALETLKSVNERLFGEIRAMRTRMLNAEEKSAHQAEEIRRLRSLNAGDHSTGFPDDAADAESIALQKQIQELEADRAGLLARLQETEEAMSRMIREKAMIEERYLELDRAEQT